MKTKGSLHSFSPFVLILHGIKKVLTASFLIGPLLRSKKERLYVSLYIFLLFSFNIIHFAVVRCKRH